MSIISDIADAVVAGINEAELSQSVTAARTFLPVFDLEDMQDLHVTVVQRGVTTPPGGRGHNQHDYAIDIAVQKKLDAVSNAEVDTLLGLVQELADLFRFKRLTEPPYAAWLNTENVPVYSPEHLEQLRQFTSVITITFRIMR